MGPTNQALLALFRADTALRDAQNDLDAATRGVRIQRKRAELAEQAFAQTTDSFKHTRAQQMELESDLKQRDEHIEHLRLQQQEAQNHKQYQAFLGEINTQKAEKARVEEEALNKAQAAESLQAQQAEQKQQAAAERVKAEELQAAIGDRTAQLEARIRELEPQRDAAADKVPPGPLGAFERLADNFEGEALAAVGHIEGKEERYYCTACNMELVVDIYNRLITRDVVATCPGCGRILYIPEELTPEMAVRQKKVAKRPSRAKSPKKAAKKTAKKDRKGVPADFKRALTTAAAESLRQAELDGQPPVEVEVRVAGVEDAAGPFRVRDAAHFRGRVNAAVQAGEIDVTFEVIDLSPAAPPPAPAGDNGDVAGLAGETHGGNVEMPRVPDADSQEAAEDVGADVRMPAAGDVDGADGSPDDPAGRVPSQPTVEPPADDETVPVGDVPDSPPAPVKPLP